MIAEKKPSGMAKIPRDMPVVLCEPHAGGWRFWCPYCRRYHHHSPSAGHRVAHCGDDIYFKNDSLIRGLRSPFRETGYWLVKL